MLDKTLLMVEDSLVTLISLPKRNGTGQVAAILSQDKARGCTVRRAPSLCTPKARRTGAYQ